MGNILHRNNNVLPPEVIQDIKQKTGFHSGHVLRLYRRFTHLDKEGNGYITRPQLLSLNDIVLNPVGDKIVDMFFPGDLDVCDFETFAKVFSVFRPTTPKTPTYADNSREAKLKFLFSVIDSNKDGELEREEVYELLEQMMGSKVSEEQLQLITDRIIHEVDREGSGTVTIADFRESTKEMDIEGVMSFVAFS